MANSTLRFVDTSQTSPVDITVRADRTSDGSYVLALPVAKSGAGDSQSIYTTAPAQLYGVVKGSAASPDTVLGPLIKAERLINIAESAVTGDGGEQLAAILGISVGTAACQTQPVGTYGGAATASTDAGGTAGGNDAAGLYGVGRALSGATGVGIGAYVQGRRESDSGKYTGLEVRASNYGVSDVAYNATAHASCGIWLNADGNADSAAGLVIGNPFGRQFEVGIAFNAQVASAKTGGVKTTSIRDDSTATNSIMIGGAHTIGMAIASGAGYGVIGASARVSSSALLEVVGADAFTDPLVQFGSAAFARGYSVRLRNSSGQSIWFIASSASEFMTGTAAGDGGFELTTGRKMLFGVASGVSALTVQNNGGVAQLGYFGVATAAKQTVSGAKGSNAALGSLLTALAAYGLITDSTSA